MLYNEQTTSGQMTKYRRAVGISIENPEGGVPSFAVVEQEVTVLPDGTKLTAIVDRLVTDLSDPSTTFDLINPNDGSVIGQTTYANVYVLLFSAYMKLAKERDAAVAQPPAPGDIQPGV